MISLTQDTAFAAFFTLIRLAFLPSLTAVNRDLLSLSAKTSYFANSDLDKSHMRTLMIYLYLTGVHLMGGYLMGVYLRVCI
jgi:hypothetical protein